MDYLQYVFLLWCLDKLRDNFKLKSGLSNVYQIYERNILMTSRYNF